MKPLKYISPDFTSGKLRLMIRAVIDVIGLLLREPSRRSFRFARLILKVKPSFTMVTNKNLITLYDLVQKVNEVKIPGDIVECGVWNGGSAAIMAAADGKHNSEKRVMWLFDSFLGLPPPGKNDGSIAEKVYFKGLDKGDAENVKKIFRQLQLSLDNVRLVPGWFQHTLNEANIHVIAILHIDADWYDSVKLVLQSFYDKVVPGGFVILDDFDYWLGCNQALNDFFAEREIENVILRKADRTGAYFQKPL